MWTDFKLNPWTYFHSNVIGMTELNVHFKKSLWTWAPLSEDQIFCEMNIFSWLSNLKSELSGQSSALMMMNNLLQTNAGKSGFG